MIHSLRQFTRTLKISAILSRYRLDEFLEATHLYRPMRLLRAPHGAITRSSRIGRYRWVASRNSSRR